MYELKINDGVAYIDDFDEAVNIIKDEIKVHFSIKQCFVDDMPCFLGAYESMLYDENRMTDRLKLKFNKIRYLLSSICLTVKMNQIDNGFSIECNQSDYLDLCVDVKKSIVDNDNLKIKEIRLKIYDIGEGILMTNMFNMNPNMKKGYIYYFDSHQVVNNKSPNDDLELGSVVRLKIKLTRV